jgi:RND family efflux transporter MFP subunit
MKKRWMLAGLVGVLGVAAGAGWWHFQGATGMGAVGSAQAAAKPDAKKDVPLEFLASEVVRARPMSLPQQITFSGPLVAPSSAIVRARTTGRLLALGVAEGQRVKAGQSIGSIDQADQSSRVAERSALVESARALLLQAERAHAQNQRLATQSFISGAALDSSGAAVQTARAQLDAALASLNTSRVALRDGTLVAPIGGIVAKRHVLPGEAVAAEQPVLTIVDLARLELAGSVATHEVSRLAPGMSVQVRVEGHGRPVSGQIARIAPAAEPGTRAIGVTVAIANRDEVYRAGQYALASVTLADDAQRLVLPLSAVSSTSGQSHVWTIRDGKLIRRAVTLGRRDESGGRVEVLEGVTGNDPVLAARFDNLREGALATVLAPGAAPMASAAAAGPPAAVAR